MSRMENIRFRMQEYTYRLMKKVGLKKDRPFLDSGDSVEKTFYGTPVVSGLRGNSIILEYLMKDKPCMVARIGTIEMGTLQAYIDKKVGVIPEIGARRIGLLCNNAGFFPAEEKAVEQFGEEYIHALKRVDLFGVFGSHAEDYVAHKYASSAKLMQISALGPYYFDMPWSSALKGKKVLVIHPFDESIKQQYSHRKDLFDDSNVLPEFTLITLRAVQTIGTNTEGFESWFDALNYMKQKISEIDFDIAIIGCGAYGLPLAAYVKEIGKKSVLMAGATQLLFGIKGARWDNAPITSKYYRDSWIRPGDAEKPKNADSVEGGCYW